MRNGVLLLMLTPAASFLLLQVQLGFGQETPALQKEYPPPVVATVNGKPITAQAYQKEWRWETFEQGGVEAIENPEELASLKEKVLDRLINIELLNQKAVQLEIEVSPEEVQQRLNALQTRYGGAKELDKILTARGTSRREFIRDFEDILRIQHLLDKEVYAKVSVNPDEAKTFYESTPKAFEKPEQIRARQIVIRVTAGATERRRERARKIIQKAADRIRSGEPFEKVAKEVSQDRSASRGGDIGYFNRGQTPPEFEKAAFSLEAGQVSEVVETASGYHLIKVEEKQPRRIIPFEEAQPRIMAYLREKKGEESLNAYITRLRKEAKIERADI